MDESTLYSDAHLIVASVRVLTHRNHTPPSIENVSEELAFSSEKSNFLCKKLKTMGVIDVVEGAFGTRLFVQDHLKVEDIPKDKKKDKLEEELKRFKDSRKNFSKKIESFQAEKAKKQKDLFAELDKKLKNKP
jgi:hypothetical protein